MYFLIIIVLLLISKDQHRHATINTTAMVCDEDDKGKYSNIDGCECLEPKIEPGDPDDNLLSVTFEQSIASCSNITSNHPLSSSLMDDCTTNDTSQGKAVC